MYVCVFVDCLSVLHLGSTAHFFSYIAFVVFSFLGSFVCWMWPPLEEQLTSTPHSPGCQLCWLSPWLYRHLFI